MKPNPRAARYERSVRRWQVKLGLVDWAFRYAYRQGDGTRFAEVDYDTDARFAEFVIFEPDADDTPERIGLHEALHILFADLLAVTAKRADAYHPDVRLEEHRVIERLLNAIDGVPK